MDQAFNWKQTFLQQTLENFPTWQQQEQYKHLTLKMDEGLQLH